MGRQTFSAIIGLVCNACICNKVADEKNTNIIHRISELFGAAENHIGETDYE